MIIIISPNTSFDVDKGEDEDGEGYEKRSKKHGNRKHASYVVEIRRGRKDKRKGIRASQ